MTMWNVKYDTTKRNYKEVRALSGIVSDLFTMQSYTPKDRQEEWKIMEDIMGKLEELMQKKCDRMIIASCNEWTT